MIATSISAGYVSLTLRNTVIPFIAPLASWNAAIPGNVPLKITAATIITKKIRL